MAHYAPGKHYRHRLSLLGVTSMLPDDATAERWFVQSRWPNGVACQACGSLNVQERRTRKPQPYRCRDCRKDFSVKTGTPMQGSNLGLRIWAIAFYLMATGIKGTSSMKLHRDLGITQKTAWHLAHRIRESWGRTQQRFAGPVETDETFVGGKERNKHGRNKRRSGRGPVGKTAVVGIKLRALDLDEGVEVRVVEHPIQPLVEWVPRAPRQVRRGDPHRRLACPATPFPHGHTRQCSTQDRSRQSL